MTWSKSLFLSGPHCLPHVHRRQFSYTLRLCQVTDQKETFCCLWGLAYSQDTGRTFLLVKEGAQAFPARTIEGCPYRQPPEALQASSHLSRRKSKVARSGLTKKQPGKRKVRVSFCWRRVSHCGPGWPWIQALLSQPPKPQVLGS